MKITNVEVIVLKSPGLYRSTDGVEEPPGPTYMGLVKVSTDSGITGYSDMETVPSVAKAAVDAPRWSEGEIEAFDGLAALLIGENPLEVERLWYRMYRGSIYYGRRGVAMQAISAIDIALWDIMGKAYGQPIHVLLGGKWRDTVRAYASTLFRPTPQAMRDAASRYIDEGFTAVKFGWGVFGNNPKLDVQLVEAAREALGPDRDLLVDTGWFVERTPKQAIQTIRAIEPFRPFFVEEILHPEDYDGYRLRRAGSDRVGVPRAHRACARRRAATGSDALRRVHGGAEDRPHGGDGECPRHPPLMVVGPADRCVAAPERVSAPRRVRGVQHLTRPAQPGHGAG